MHAYIMFAFVAERETDADPPFFSTCFTDAFRDSWSQSENGVNPVTRSEIYYPSWLTARLSETVFSSADEHAIRITLGSGSEENRLLVRVVRQDSWKIADVIADEGQ